MVADDVTAPVITYETLIAMKQAAARPRDLADIADLTRIQELKRQEQND
jgi:hypothetical protein